MINRKHLLKAVAAWISIVYVVCYVGVAVFPAVRSFFIKYAIHANVALTSDYFSWGYFIGGLIIWNIVALVLVWLFVSLFNAIKK